MCVKSNQKHKLTVYVIRLDMANDSDNDEILDEDDLDEHQTVDTESTDHGFGLHRFGV